MGDFKIFNKDLHVIPNSFTLWDVKDNLFNLRDNSNRISNINDIDIEA